MEIIKFLRRSVESIPHGRLFDSLFSLGVFVYAHRRVPRRGSMLFNDYLFFLKNSDEIVDIFRQITSDKVLVKEFVRQQCGDGFTLETLAIYYNIESIYVDALPRPCVIKPAHSGGSIVYVEDDQDFLTTKQKETLQTALNSSLYMRAREANYRHLRSRLICEPMFPSGKKTKDYKVFCYKGQPRIVQVDSNRHADHRRNIYEADWTPLDIEYNFPRGEWESQPQCLFGMLDLAKKLSSLFVFVRIDFFVHLDKFYVVEITHCPENSHGKFDSRESEALFSKILFSVDCSR